MLDAWSLTNSASRFMCIHHVFEMQAIRTPDAPAVIDATTSLSYAQLDAQANQLAHLLQQHGVGPDRHVALYLDRSVAFVVAVLATLKAGGAYVPLDATQPSSRLHFILRDSQPAVLLTQEAFLTQVPADLPMICLDRDAASIAAAPATPPASAVTPEHLAYVMYTSGSTGQPKGVMVPHRAIHRLVCNTNYIQILTDDTIAHASNCAFDASTFEIWGALLNGARLAIITKDVMLSPEEFVAQLQNYSVTTLWLTTALFNQLSRIMPGAFKNLRHLLVGGEALDPRRIKDVLLNQPPQRLLNGYGPTETTTFAAWHLIEHVPDNAVSIPIGKALTYDRLYVLDGNLQPVADGVTGELYVGGAGVSRGYLNRPDLTAERFIPNPFVEAALGTDESMPVAERLYKTGDLVRYLPDGSIEYVGRIDHQVKLRGFRIELGEIEAHLNQHAQVCEAIVLVREDVPGDKRLVAYVVPTASERAMIHAPAFISELRQHLKKDLPDYMVPAAFVLLDVLPVTPNGKVDRKALPAPDCSRVDEETLVKPRTPAETAVADIWADVLGLTSIGVDDNFFALGGHSLMAGQVLVRLREAFQHNLSIQMLFEHPTVAELVDAISAQLGGATIADNLAQTYCERQAFASDLNRLVGDISTIDLDVQRPASGHLPLSFPQQRLWMVERLDPGNLSYLVPQTLRLTGPLNIAALKHSVNDLVRRHEALRTVFRLVNGDGAQVVLPELDIPLPIVDLEALDAADQAQGVQQLARMEAQRAFDLAHGPLFRTTLLRLSAEEHVLLFTIHHILVDDWSLSIFWRELSACYKAHVTGQPVLLGELKMQYPDAALWQREWLQGIVQAEQVAYWAQQLNGCASVLHLPTDRPRPAKQTFCGARETIVLPKSLTRALTDLSQREGATLYMTLLATFQVLLQRYSGQSDFVVGTPMSNRRRREFEDLIGFFINTLALRADVSGNPSFRELLGRVRETALGAYMNQDLPFEQVVELAQPERDPSRNPLFQVMFALQNAPQQAVQLEGLTVEPLPHTSITAQFDLFLEMIQVKDGLFTSFEYNTDLFDASTIARMMRHFQTLLESVVNNPDQHISALPILPMDEQRQIVVDWNATQAMYPEHRRLHELVEAQVARTPNAIAAVFEDQQLTYRELDRRANQLAHHLQSLGVGPDVAVGIYIERSIEMVVGVLGVLKAGGAYLPLDPSYPQERLTFMLADTQAPVLLTQDRLVATLPEHRAHVIRLDTDWERIACEPTWPTINMATADNLAYLIYTSGSTGRPKGVAMPQRSLINLLTWQLDQWTPGRHTTTLQFASLSFDVSFQEIFSTWCSGGTLALISAETRQDSVQLLHVLEREGVERIFLPFVALQFLAEAAAQQDRLPSRLREIITAGEQLQMTPAIVRMLERLGNCTLHNHYGPSETHVVTAHDLVGQPTSWAALPPIGRPINNTQIYVLDQNLRPVPVGIPGEIYIGGDVLARGYLNRPELTADKFVPDPFSVEPGARLYKTGDLARYLPNGDISFMGRIDHQVKVRGFRIELGEIETLMQQYAGVRECVVIVREDVPGDKRVVAYVVPAHDAECTVDGLSGFLRSKLPDYMVPSAIVLLEALPLTPNSKVDRRALPAPSRVKQENQRPFVAPRTPLEMQLAALWANLFGMERVGIDEDFFALGGHSLLAIRLMANIKALFGIDLPLRELFASPTIAGCAQAIEARQQVSAGDEALQPLLDLIADTALDLSIRPQVCDDWFVADPKALFLTGATGFLGAFMLHELLRTTNADVYCLVRAKTSAEGMRRLRATLEEYKLWDERLGARIVVVAGDLGQPRFGLSEEAFAKLALTIDGIYHSGAMVSFIYPYAALRSINVLGTQEALRLACQGKMKPFHYVSTIAVATTAEVSTDGRVYEHATLGAIDSFDSGYVQTKWVAEHLVMAAQERGLPVSIYRPGRIAGHSATGASNPDDFISRLIMGWIQLGSAPAINTTENLMPVDYVAQAIVHLSLQRDLIGQVFHMLNPQSINFNQIAQAINDAGFPVRLLPYAEWYKALFATAQNEHDNVLYPLLSFLSPLPTEEAWIEFLTLPRFDCQNTFNGLANSSIKCPTFSADQIESVLSYFAEQGILDLGYPMLTERAVEPVA
jgi:amino acid adenylation domain-containing protein/thioester reductase-like protein